MLHRSALYENYVTSGQAGTISDGENWSRPRTPYFHKLVHDHFPADRTARILDIGCGHGALLDYCRSAGYKNLEGVDTSAEQVALARRRGIGDVHHADLLPYLSQAKDASFDVVVAFDVLEHFTRPEIMKILAEANRVLKPSGKLIIHSPNGESPFCGMILYGDFSHELAFTRFSLSQLSRVSGYSAISCYEDKPIPHGLASLVRRILWEILRLGYRFVVAVETGRTDRSAIFSTNLLAIITK